MKNNLYINHSHTSKYSLLEELINSISHGIGFILSVIGLIILYIQASTYGTHIHVLSYSIFGVTLIALYSASTLYHYYSNTRFYKTLKIIDHFTIYFLIAGTYSPFMLAVIKGNIGWVMFKTIWVLAILGCILKFSKRKFFQRVAFINYLLMGWLVIFILDQLIICISARSFCLLAIGGILYTVGVVFYLWHNLPFNHSIWHMFVLAGSISHYFAIYYLIQ